MLKLIKKFFLNTLLLSTILTTIIILIGRNHFLLGSILNFGRFALGLTLLLLVLFSKQRKVKTICGTLLILVVLEFLLTSISYKRTEVLDSNLINKEITLLTYNLYFKNRNPLKSIKEIEKANPDILVVQELTPKWKAILDDKLIRLKYQSTKSLKGTHGLGIYSKYPLKKTTFINNSNRLPIAQRTIIKIGKEEIELCNIHLSSPAIAVENPDKFWYYYSKNYKNREKQFEKISTALNLNKKIKKQILIGDLNTMNYEPLYNQIRKDWIDLFAKEGKGVRYNFPNSSRFPFPFLTLDYIFIKGNIKGIESKVLKGGSSDHLGIKGIIEI